MTIDIIWYVHFYSKQNYDMSNIYGSGTQNYDMSIYLRMT